MSAQPTNEPDWKGLLRARLAELDLSPSQEEKVLEELAQLLSDASRDADLDLDSAVAVEAWLEEQITESKALAEIPRSGRPLGPPLSPFAPPQPSSRVAPGAPSARRRQIILQPFLTLFGNLRYALRRLAHKPAFTAIAIVSLAIGIGANAAIFSFVHALMDHDRALEAPEELVNVYSSVPSFSSSPMSMPDYLDIRDNAQGVFEGVAISRPVFAKDDSDGAQCLPQLRRGSRIGEDRVG